MRLIAERVKPTPGSQLALFATYSYHGFITDRDGDTLELEAEPLPANRECDTEVGVGLNHLPSGRSRAASDLRQIALVGERKRCLEALALAGRLTRSARRLNLPRERSILPRIPG